MAATLAGFSPGETGAAVQFNVTINDPGGSYSAYHAAIESNLEAAGADIGSYLQGYGDKTVNLQVNFTNEITMSGGSTWAQPVGTRGTQTVIQEGAAATIKGYTRPAFTNGIDATIGIGTGGYLQNDLWFDPDPQARTAPIPSGKTDAYSRFLHELQHILIFNGRYNFTDASQPQGLTHISAYDTFVERRTEQFNGSDYVTAYFTGPNAVAVYGADVPLHYGNYTHVGNSAPRRGTDLTTFQRLEVMNGVTTFTGVRYEVSPLDLAVFRDVGLSTVPEPTAAGVAAIGAACALVTRRWRPRRARAS